MEKAKEPRAVKTPHYGPFPKYLQIRDVIVRWLSAQKVGEHLPTEMALSDKFGVEKQFVNHSSALNRAASFGGAHAQAISRQAAGQESGPPAYGPD